MGRGWWQNLTSGRLFIAFAALSVSATLLALVPPAVAAIQIRSTIDRPDDISGFQIHVVYVVPDGSSDLNLDTNGQIDSWVKEGNSWLDKKVNRNLRFDIFQGATDVTFIKSQFSINELCFRNCKALSKLESEFRGQNPTFDSSKTLLFMVADVLDRNSCGWAQQFSNLALAQGFGDSSKGCNLSSSKAKTGISGPAKTIIHELFHTFGLGHVCIDASDLMLGEPECKIDDETYGDVPITFDMKRNQYLDSEVGFGIDLLKMPIWSDGKGSSTYAEVKEVSGLRSIPTLEDGTPYAVIGETSETFGWAWDRDLYPTGAAIECLFETGLSQIAGRVENSSCIFDVPTTLRAGNQFTVVQKWKMGPWSGMASVSGKLVREDFSSAPCTESTCFAGGESPAKSLCWPKDVKVLTLQQLIKNRWVKVATTRTTRSSFCDSRTPNSTNYSIKFSKTGTYKYRWFIPARSGYQSYQGKPFTVIVNDFSEPEPRQG
jgi:hypothetical protein